MGIYFSVAAAEFLLQLLLAVKRVLFQSLPGVSENCCTDVVGPLVLLTLRTSGCAPNTRTSTSDDIYIASDEICFSSTPGSTLLDLQVIQPKKGIVFFLCQLAV